MGSTISAAFFDLDHTLIRSNSGKLLVMHAKRKRLISKTDILKALYLSALYRTGIRSEVEVIASFTSLMKGVAVETFSVIVRDAFEKHIRKDFRPGLLHRIAFHKNQGTKTIILSSALYPVCRIISDHLGLEDPLCSELETRDGIYTGNSLNNFCFGEEKVSRLKTYCERNNTDPANCWYYGDSISDAPVMKMIGHPICIDPDRKLKKKALSFGWEIM